MVELESDQSRLERNGELEEGRSGRHHLDGRRGSSGPLLPRGDTKLTTIYGPEHLCDNCRDWLRSSSTQANASPRRDSTGRSRKVCDVCVHGRRSTWDSTGQLGGAVPQPGSFLRVDTKERTLSPAFRLVGGLPEGWCLSRLTQGAEGNRGVIRSC